MTYELKPDVHRKIAYIDRKTQAVTAGQSNPFEVVLAEIDGFGSEKLDYTMYVRLDSLGEIRMTAENLLAYSEDYIKGRSSTASAGSTGSKAYIEVCECTSITYPSLAEIKVTGYVGNKRHISVFHTYYDGANVVQKTSYYTADTSTELKSFEFYSPVNDTLIYSIFGTAVPKVQYNPNCIKLPRVEWSAQSDTRNVSGFSGEDYDVFIDCHLDSSETDYIDVRVNGVATSTRTRQQMQNAGGSISSANSTQSIDARLHTGDCLINKEIGRKSIAVTSNNYTGSAQQTEQYTGETNTSTEFTNIDLVPSGTVSGYCDVYLIPKGLNADLTPWDFRQTIDISGDFSAGQSFNIPDWACLMKVDFVGDSVSGGPVISLDFNNLSIPVDQQVLKSLTSTTSAHFTSASTIGLVRLASSFNTLISLKNGVNRSGLSKANYSENTTVFYGLTLKDSSTVFTSAQIKASNSNSISGLLTVSFH